ncbi:hypothetical protein EVAR_6091_1 [Eumeta japonica]|uniref:Uncharacterized protein n=1 Tax=Eumeta variegata TaxID=151549 RepID=A0A4C1TH42_EUMVA|nr:hypothetical protein EVAR_6091_1 [Eumeta japonica]
MRKGADPAPAYPPCLLVISREDTWPGHLLNYSGARGRARGLYIAFVSDTVYVGRRVMDDRHYGAAENYRCEVSVVSKNGGKKRTPTAVKTPRGPARGPFAPASIISRFFGRRTRARRGRRGVNSSETRRCYKSRADPGAECESCARGLRFSLDSRVKCAQESPERRRVLTASFERVYVPLARFIWSFTVVKCDNDTTQVLFYALSRPTITMPSEADRRPLQQSGQIRRRRLYVTGAVTNNAVRTMRRQGPAESSRALDLRSAQRPLSPPARSLRERVVHKGHGLVL